MVIPKSSDLFPEVPGPVNEVLYCPPCEDQHKQPELDWLWNWLFQPLFWLKIRFQNGF